jgi:hypothetical protein
MRKKEDDAGKESPMYKKLCEKKSIYKIQNLDVKLESAERNEQIHRIRNLLMRRSP